MKTRPARALAVIGLGSACGACARPPAPVYSAAPAPDVVNASDVVAADASDARVAYVLIRELDREPILRAEHIHVSIDLGIAVLDGRVADRLAKDRAVELARVVRSVRAVVDRIDVAPVRRPEGDLELVVAGVLSNDPVTAPQRIVVRASEGVVHLSGDVDSMGTRRIAERNVLAIPGVIEVLDDLAVRPQRLSDAWVVSAVERIVHDDPWLDASALRVSARGGVVELAGRVASGAERARAEDDAREASPADVDVSALQIEDVFHDDGTLRATPGWTPGDRDIAQAVRDAYIIDPRVRCAPTVQVRDGVVVLTGVAPTRPALRAAEEDALHVTGVARVRDDLSVQRTRVAEDDGALRAEVAALIAGDPQLGTLHIAVQALRGRVLLRGSVPTETDRMRAISLASFAPGTIDVDDDGLAVVPARLAAIPRADTTP